jgi:hypothetical protein
LVLPELTGIGAIPPARASLASLAKRCAPAISPISLPAASGPKPGSASNRGAAWTMSSAICRLERVDGLRQLAQAAQLVARDPDPRGVLGAGDGERVDAVGLAAITPGPALAGHQPRGDADDAFAVDEQQPLAGTRDMATVLQGPDPIGAQARRPIELGAPAVTDRDGRVAEQLAGARGDGGEGVSACACPRRARSSPSSLPRNAEVDARRTGLARGRCHAPYLCRDPMASAGSAIDGLNC